MEYIHWICSDCGRKLLELPENIHKKPFNVSTYHTGSCDLCKVIKAVTELRDFGYPFIPEDFCDKVKKN